MKQPRNDKLPVFEMMLKQVGDEPYVVSSAVPSETPVSSDWHEDHQEGQLAVDVIDAGDRLVVVSTMAGAETDKLEIFLHNDLLTVRGVRLSPIQGGAVFLHQECFWGKFSRTIVLPVDVKGYLARAEYKNGIVTITIPKQEQRGSIPILIVEE